MARMQEMTNPESQGSNDAVLGHRSTTQVGVKVRITELKASELDDGGAEERAKIKQEQDLASRAAAGAEAAAAQAGADDQAMAGQGSEPDEAAA